jgi:transcriptional regulator with XRE-family HTH domain
MNMKNPLFVIRKKLGITVSEMGVYTGVSPMTIQRIEAGNLRQVTPVVLETLERLGYNKELLVFEYKKWKSYRVNQLHEKIKQD